MLFVFHLYPKKKIIINIHFEAYGAKSICWLLIAFDFALHLAEQKKKMVNKKQKEKETLRFNLIIKHYKIKLNKIKIKKYKKQTPKKKVRSNYRYRYTAFELIDLQSDSKR